MDRAVEAGTTPYGVSPARYDETIFCHDRVRYVGDEIAAVAAVDLDTALDHLHIGLTTVASTEDAQEGVKAFLEKREPEWRGR